MDISKIKIGKRVSFAARKTMGRGKIVEVKPSETGVWVTIDGKVTHARATTKGDWLETDDARPVTVTVRPSQVSA